MVPPPSTTPASRCSSAHGGSDTDQPPTSASKGNYMSGNEQPGYPPNSPQLRSSCNSSGYSGQTNQSEFGDQSMANGTTSYQGSQKSPAYSQSHPSPGYHHLQQSPSQKQNCFPQSSPSHSSSPGYEMYDNRQGTQYYNEMDKNNVNARIKTMIMNKQNRCDILTSPNGKERHGDYGGKRAMESSENTNHFLAFSHHLRDGSVLHPEGGGHPHWTGPPQAMSNHHFYSHYDYNQNTKDFSAMEKFMKFASADFDKIKPQSPMGMGKKMTAFDECYSPCDYQDPIRTLEKSFPTKREHHNNNELYAYYPNNQIPHQNYYPSRCFSDYCPDIKQETPDVYGGVEIKSEPIMEEEEEEEEECLYPRISYAPSLRKHEVIHRNSDKDLDTWAVYRKKMEDERSKAKVDEEAEEKHVFPGDGGPLRIDPTTGPWCCRLGGVEKPSPDHLKDGCCQVRIFFYVNFILQYQVGKM